MQDKKTALLVMDIQPGIVASLGDSADEYMSRVRSVVDAAHAKKIKVFYVVVRFREGYPEISAANKSFSLIRERYPDNPLDREATATMPVIEPTADDLVVAKKRVSAFAGSDLDMLLRAQGINHLVLCGIATSGVVLSTLRYAADEDYYLTVLSDCCADSDPEVHQVLVGKVFPRQADVILSQEWVAGLN